MLSIQAGAQGLSLPFLHTLHLDESNQNWNQSEATADLQVISAMF